MVSCFYLLHPAARATTHIIRRHWPRTIGRAFATTAPVAALTTATPAHWQLVCSVDAATLPRLIPTYLPPLALGGGFGEATGWTGFGTMNLASGLGTGLYGVPRGFAGYVPVSVVGVAGATTAGVAVGAGPDMTPVAVPEPGTAWVMAVAVVAVVLGRRVGRECG